LGRKNEPALIGVALQPLRVHILSHNRKTPLSRRRLSCRLALFSVFFGVVHPKALLSLSNEQYKRIGDIKNTRDTLWIAYSEKTLNDVLKYVSMQKINNMHLLDNDSASRCEL